MIILAMQEKHLLYTLMPREIVDSLLIQNIPRNGSYGRNPEGDFGYFLTTTPNQANIEIQYSDVV